MADDHDKTVKWLIANDDGDSGFNSLMDILLVGSLVYFSGKIAGRILAPSQYEDKAFAYGGYVTLAALVAKMFMK